MSQIEVARNANLIKGDLTTGIARDKAFERDSALFARSRIAGGVTSGWHHHGARDLFGYLVRGKLRFEYDKNRVQSVEVETGDFFHIPMGVVHRDVNPSANEEAVVVNILVGGGPTVVNVPNP